VRISFNILFQEFIVDILRHLWMIFTYWDVLELRKLSFQNVAVKVHERSNSQHIHEDHNILLNSIGMRLQW